MLFRRILDHIHQVLIQPFRDGPELTKRLLHTLIAAQGLLAPTFSMIPFLFYRPAFFCQSPDGTQYHCSEAEACSSPALHYEAEYGFDSIPVDFKLYCADKKVEATILTFMMVGHFVSSLIASYLSKYANNKRNLILILIYSNILCAFGLILSIFSYTIAAVEFVLFLWCMGMDIINSLVNCLPVTFYPQRTSKKIMGIQQLAWSFCTIILCFMFALIQNWRIFLCLCVGLPHLLVAYRFWKDLDELSHFRFQQSTHFMQAEDNITSLYTKMLEDKKQMDNVSEVSLQILQKQPRLPSVALSTEAQQQQIVTFMEVYSSHHFRFILVYFFIYGGSYVAAFSSMVSLNTLSGNIYANIIFVTLFEMILTLLGTFMASSIDIKSALIKVYLLMGLGYTAFPILPNFMQQLVIMQGKLLTDVTWILLAVYTFQVMPRRFLPFVFAVRSIYNLGLYVVLPYTKYYLELTGLRIFAFSGFYETAVALALYLSADRIN